MLKNLLTCLLCLCVCFCFSQDSVLQVFQADSSRVITDFVSTTKDNAKVLLNWRTPFFMLIDFFSIERSSNGNEFEVITVVKQSPREVMQEWTDEAPAKGRNLYRIRCTAKDGQTFFSRTIVVQVAGDISFRFYPNPVDDVLIIRSESTIDVQIIDATGKARVQLNQVQGLQLINVSHIEKGVYLLRIQNRQANMVRQEKLLKN